MVDARLHASVHSIALETHLPLADHRMIAAIATQLAVVTDTQVLLRRQTHRQPHFNHQAVAVQRAAFNIEGVAADQKSLPSLAVDIAIEVPPAKAGLRGQADAIVQLAQMSQAHPEATADIVLGLRIHLE